jgi:polyhydroxybutyrate depolymerase
MLQVDTLSRTYVLHIPPAYAGNRPAPLIIDFHAIGSSGQTESSTSPYPAVTDPEGVIMAFPDGREGPAGNAWNVGPCCVAGVDDVKFATTLVDDIAKSVCIDRSRVYAVGVSVGGGMANYVACHAANVFAAVAPAGFAFLEGSNVDNCSPLRPMTTIAFRGTAEGRVLYDGGSSDAVYGMHVTFLSAKQTFDRWGQLDGCNGVPIVDSNGCSRYADCRDGVLVVLCTKEGGHEEPGDPTVAWPLLKSYVLP